MATMNQQNINKIATNIEILKSIFKLLNFEEQLKFAQVSLQFKYVFCNFIWTVNYAKVLILKDPPNFYVRNETQLNTLSLTLAELTEFVNLYGPEIKELNLEYLKKMELSPEIGVDKKKLLKNCNSCLNINKFPNLTSLSYNNMILTESELLSVVRHCKRLETLRIYNCFDEKYNLFVLTRDRTVKTIVEMKQLKYLSWGNNMEQLLNYEDFCELVIKSNIKHLFLKNKIEADENPYTLNKELNNGLLELEISTSFCKTKWGVNFSSYLSHFENLLNLTLQDVDHNMDDATLNILAKNCKKLKKLSINFTTFENVSNFNLFSSVEELNLQICEGLTHSNLRQILTEMNLIKFSSLWTKYEGKFEDFPISNKIQFLNIEALKTPEFKGAYEDNDSLRSLIWHDDYGLASKPLTLKCPNLHNLEVKSGFIPLELLLQLTSLRSLTIRYPALKYPWSFISQLLSEHVSLKEFTLDELCYKLDSKAYPPKAFKCSENIKSVKIPSHVFEAAIDFWLDFVEKNRHVKLICLGWISQDALDNLINSSKFPNFLKIIYIYGFKVACKDLRTNFDYTLEKINFDKHRRLSLCDNSYEIIL